MPLTVLTTSPVWTAMGWTMLHLAWVGAVIALFAAFSRRLFKSARPERRHAVALVWLMLVAVSPVVIFLGVFEPDSIVTVGQVGSAGTAQRANVAVSSFSESVMATRSRSKGFAMIGPTGSGRSRIESLIPFLPAIWLAGSLSTLFMLATGLIGVARLRRSSRIIESGAIPERLRALADSLGIARCVGVGIYDRLAVPVLIGIVRPLILLPPAALCGWSVEQLEMVLLHELAHLRRWDNLVNLIQRIIESLLFFHPVVWWLSDWVRLERELCCDQLVVGRIGQPLAYAEMLVALTGSRLQGRNVVLAMADRNVMTRIQRLFNLEDRSMKLSMPEGFGLLGAVIVGGTLAFGLQAAQPRAAGETQESVRRALRESVDRVSAEPSGGPRRTGRLSALTTIAQAQLSVGDRASGLATLQRAYDSIVHLDAKKRDRDFLVELVMVARFQRKAGDLVAARRSLDRVTKLLYAWEATASGSSGQKLEDSESYYLSDMLARLAEERSELGDLDSASALARRALVAIGRQKGMTKVFNLGYVAGRLFKAGDVEGARQTIEQARRVGLELPDPKEKDRAMIYLAKSMREIGGVDEAIAMARSFDRSVLQEALRSIAESYADENDTNWSDFVSIKITVGADSLTIADRAAAERDLPKIAQAVRDTDTPIFQARTLALIAHLQAKAGDLAGSLRTVEIIPDMVRKDFPGPVSGQYDAIKPITFAMIAVSQAEIGDVAGARVTILHALTLARAIETIDQKLVALVFIAQKQIECGERELAPALIGEALSFTLAQPEPRRSRCLTVLLETQLKCGDVAGATRTAEAVREDPGLEKRKSLQTLADWHEKHGDEATAQTLLRRALQFTPSKPQEKGKEPIGKAQRALAITADTFIDPDIEIDPRLAAELCQMDSMLIHARLGDMESAHRVMDTQPAATRVQGILTLAAMLAHLGKVPAALEIAAGLETAEDRVTAYEAVASAVRGSNVKP